MRLPERARDPLALLAISLVGLVLVALWHPGQEASPDALVYLDAARNLRAGHGLTLSSVPFGATERTPLTVFAPGFPLWLALAGALTGDVQAGAPLAMGAALLGWGLASYALWRALGGRPALGALLAALLMSSAPALGASNRILSDLPAATWVVGCSAWLCRPRPGAPRAGARPRAGATGDLGLGLALGLAFLWRWSNLFFVVGSGLLLLHRAWRARRETAPDRGRLAGRRLLLVGLGCVLVIAPWLLRNALRAGQLFGTRPPGTTPLQEVLLQAGDGLSHPIRALPRWSRFPVIGLSLAALALRGLRRWRASRAPQTSPAPQTSRPSQPPQRPRAGPRALIGPLLLAACYAALLIAARLRSPFDPLSDSRFWLPVYAWLLLAGARWLTERAGRTTASPHPRRDRPARLLAGLSLGLALLGQGARIASRLDEADRSLGALAPNHRARLERVAEALAGCPVLVSNLPRELAPVLPAGRLIQTQPGDSWTPAPGTCVAFHRSSPQRWLRRRIPGQRTALRQLDEAGALYRAAEFGHWEVWKPPAPSSPSSP